MKENNTIFDYIEQVCVIYGFTIVALVLFTIVVGDEAKEESLIFTLGSKGLSVEILLQFLLLSFIMVVLRVIFLSDKLIKNMGLVPRSVCFLGSIVLVIIIFVITCSWFPINDMKAWGGFFISFSLCTVVSIALTILREHLENKKMEEALQKFNNRQ